MVFVIDEVISSTEWKEQKAYIIWISYIYDSYHEFVKENYDPFPKERFLFTTHMNSKPCHNWYWEAAAGKIEVVTMVTLYVLLLSTTQWRVLLHTWIPTKVNWSAHNISPLPVIDLEKLLENHALCQNRGKFESRQTMIFFFHEQLF